MMRLNPGSPRDKDKEPISGLGGLEKTHRESDIKPETRGEFSLKFIKLKPQSPQ